MDNIQQLMSLKRSLIVMLLFTSCHLFAQMQTITPLYADNQEILLNGSWKFKYIPGLYAGGDSLFFQDHFDTSSWSDIKVPGHWDLQGFAEPIYGLPEEALGLYVTSFEIPDSYMGRQVFIKLEGVLYGYDLYVNGRWAGNWESSYHAASFNITDLVKNGRNRLAVRVTTRSKGFEFDRCDNWALAGIFRDVSIFSLPNIYIDDYTITTSLNEDESATVRVVTEIKNNSSVLAEDLALRMLLYAPDGGLVGEGLTKIQSSSCSRELTVKNPLLWNAEEPVLYHLKLQLLKDDIVSQEVNQKVGIREIAIVDEVLMLNNKPLKLKGVNYHDLSPETGKYMTEEQLITDLLLMKKANINFIRTCHNPPERRKLELCDSLGFYVSDEMPYAFGSEHMWDPTFREVMLKRAKATVLRDKNHPCVIMWTIGNENDIVRHTVHAGKLVKELDPTRPISYAGTGDLSTIPDFADIYSPHYPSAQWVRDYKGEAKRPVIFTEYAHALGLSFGNQEEIWKEIFRDKHIAGGAVWHFQDQGIIHESESEVDTMKLTYDVWIDSVTYYKSTLEGTDGIVYADRTPQTDYWQLRKVYSPIQIVTKELPLSSGEQRLKLVVYNQFDFNDLNALQGKWELFKNRELYQRGDLTINCAPHDTTIVFLPVTLPREVADDVWLLKFSFSDKNQVDIYEHTVSLVSDQGCQGIKYALSQSMHESRLKIKNNVDSLVSISGKNYLYEVKEESITLSLLVKGKKIPVINEGVLARVGSEPIMADVVSRDRYYADEKNYYWDPFLLYASKAKSQDIQQDGNGYHGITRAVFPRVGELYDGEQIEGDIEYTINQKGELVVNFDLHPVNVSGFFLSAGVSFILDPGITNFRWLGDGPYPSYPGKHALSDFGIYQMKKGDLHFNGNRRNVEMATLTDDDGNGIAILCDGANIAVEVKNGQMVVSYNSLVSGMGNKKILPTVLHKASEVEQIKGTFAVIPLTAGNWPKGIQDVLGYPDKSVKVNNPFYYSYDSSK
jgi:beta-galactosidase